MRQVSQKTGEVVELSCAIGDDRIDGKPYSEIVEIVREYIRERGGFEKFAKDMNIQPKRQYTLADFVS